MKLPASIGFGQQEISPFSINFTEKRGFSSMPSFHFHPQYEIYYLISGERNYFIKDQSYRIQKGNLVFINRNEVHKTTDSGLSDHERIVIYFHDHFLETHYPSQKELLLQPFQSEDPVFRFNVQDQLIVAGFIAKLLKEMLEKPPGYEIILHHHFIELLLFTIRRKESTEAALQKSIKPMHQKVSEIVRFINIHYQQPLSLVSLSEQFYISTFYLSRIFKEFTGFTFTEYLNLVRIKEAQRQLQESNLPITKIAESLGFENFSHFGKVFKKITHVSPRVFRKT